MTPPKSLLTSQKGKFFIKSNIILHRIKCFIFKARDRAKRDKLRYSEATKSFERARSAEPPKDVIILTFKSMNHLFFKYKNF